MGPIVTFATITDGLSNTAMFSEWVRGKNNTASMGVHQIYKGALRHRDRLRPTYQLSEFVQDHENDQFRPKGHEVVQPQL